MLEYGDREYENKTDRSGNFKDSQSNTNEQSEIFSKQFCGEISTIMS